LKFEPDLKQLEYADRLDILKLMTL